MAETDSSIPEDAHEGAADAVNEVRDRFSKDTVTPENAREWAADAVTECRERFGLEPDYTPTSLTFVDRVLEEMHKAGRKSREQPGAVVLFGCYLGEVLIRNLGGKWVKAEEVGFKLTGFPIVVTLTPEMSCNPLGKVAKAIDEGPGESVVTLYAGVANQLGRQTGKDVAAAGGSMDGIDWPTRPDPDGRGVPLIQVLARPGPESEQAAYLMLATSRLAEEGWGPLEYQTTLKDTAGPFTIPCVVKKGDECRLVFSHRGHWKLSDYHRFLRWNERVRGCEHTRGVPVVIVHDEDPTWLRENGYLDDRFGIAAHRVEGEPASKPEMTAAASSPPMTSPGPVENGVAPGEPGRRPDAGPGLIGFAPRAIAATATPAKHDRAGMPRPAYAGFWIRFLALAIDIVILSVVEFVAMFLYAIAATLAGRPIDPDSAGDAGISLAIALAIPCAYFALMEGSTLQATLGKAALSLKVVDVSGRRISIARALGRYLGKIPSSISLVGILMAAFTDRKQALHDKMAGTLVVRGR